VEKTKTFLQDELTPGKLLLERKEGKRDPQETTRIRGTGKFERELKEIGLSHHLFYKRPRKLIIAGHGSTSP